MSGRESQLKEVSMNELSNNFWNGNYCNELEILKRKAERPIQMAERLRLKRNITLTEFARIPLPSEVFDEMWNRDRE